MSFLCSLEEEFLVKPWLCSTCQGSGLRGWIWNGTAAATIRILCLIIFQRIMRILMVMTILQKKMMFSHLSRFGSKSFAEEQLVLIEQHLYKLCDKACGSPMCISQIQMCQNSIEEVWEKISVSVFDNFHLTPLWSIAEKYLLLAFVLSHNLGDVWLWLIFVNFFSWF